MVKASYFTPIALFSSWRLICYTFTEEIIRAIILPLNTMKGTYLGEFEEVVLLAVALRHGQAYGAAIVSELEKQINRPVNLGAVHAALNRLAEKGFVTSEMGGETAERGGRRKRLYRVTSAGSTALREIHTVRNQMWNLIPKIALP